MLHADDVTLGWREEFDARTAQHRRASFGYRRPTSCQSLLAGTSSTPVNGGALVELAIDAADNALPRIRAAAMAVVRETAPELTDDAVLVLTELATNALLHGEPPVVLRLLPAEGGVRIEVEDSGGALPQYAGHVPEAATGRGLWLVSALARAWGVEPRVQGRGKVVWADLGAPTADRAAPTVGRDTLVAACVDDTAEPTVTVHLGEVPTGLLLQAKAHVDDLVRELTWAAAGAGGDLPGHLASVVEGVVRHFAAVRNAIKHQALDAAARGSTTTDLTLTLPASTADAGEEYLAALDRADDYARTSCLLTLGTPPAHRAFRRWYVEAIVGQARARAAGQPPPPSARFQDVFDARSGERCHGARPRA